jgi:hypothetical protein
MNIQIKKLFKKVLIYSLNTDQINYLGERHDHRFNVSNESGFGPSVPVPPQTAAETLLMHFNGEEKLVELFTYLLRHEGLRFHDRILKIWGKVELIKLLEKNKWIYDDEIIRFFLDPFYEHEINFLKNIRVLDLREKADVKKIIDGITKVSKKMGIHDLEWRITVRLYDLDAEIAQLIRKIIELLLVKQNLQPFAYEAFTCLKELALNASKANYKLLFERFVTRKQKVSSHSNYFHFLRLFKDEIEEYGNSRLYKLAEREDKFINIIFQSTNDSIEIFVTNCDAISAIEKSELLKKVDKSRTKDSFSEEDYAEGAGLGINLVMSILRKYSKQKNLLKVIFYPTFLKVGFSIKRSDIINVINQKNE